ncbi:MAG TPA: ABC transporter ATP-binding protein [Oligoflexia bacterium]|nr:ABC transporter ATP-binding protein [Oligoflexia bacterium]HMR24478.1 ABC transporter ATP-binding protein [Oligoflexia bacterium]
MEKNHILEVKNLSVGFNVNRVFHLACENIDFQLQPNKTLCLVGESGSGKSVTAQGIFAQQKLAQFKYGSGEVFFKNKDILTLSDQQKSKIRGKHVGFIPQDPFEALNPVVKVGKQVEEAYLLHFPQNKTQAKERVINFFKKVGLSAPERRYDAYPHELSGGMLQRVLIAHALICEPDVLIADEPTTALDVTIQAQILDLLKAMQKQHGMAILFITHDFGVVCEMADDVAVMYAGQMVEYADIQTLMKNPKHPYTKALIASVLNLENEHKGKKLPFISGTVPSLKDYPEHCRFYERCRQSEASCLSYDMKKVVLNENHWARCIKAQ